MIQIEGNTIGTSAPVREWVRAMEDAFIDTAEGKIEVPPREHIDQGMNTLLIMPCFGRDYFATKLVSVFPKNHLKHKPVIYGTVVLNDGHTGEPLAVLDGSKLTAMRTAAVGSVGVKHLAPENATTLGIIGLGIQGLHQALFACEVRPIKELRIMDHSREVMKLFADRFQDFFKHVKVIACDTAAELCSASEIIITATGSHHPVIPEKSECWRGKTIIGIGSYKPEMREFPDELLSEVSQVFVDTMHAVVETGDLMIPLEKGLIRKEQVIPMSELISGIVGIQGETRFFKSVGMAAFDLYGARLVYENVPKT